MKKYIDSLAHPTQLIQPTLRTTPSSATHSDKKNIGSKGEYDKSYSASKYFTMQRRNKAGLNTVKKRLTVFKELRRIINKSDKQNTIEA